MADSHWAIGPVYYWLTTSFFKFFITISLQEHLLSGHLFYLGSSQRISNILSKFPTQCSITFGHFPTAFLYPFISAQHLSNSLYEHTQQVL
jgi:hypothetical protein